MEGILNWLFVESIYGIVIVGSSIYGIANYIKRFLPKEIILKIPDLTPIFGVLFIIYISTVPTYPRYKFHKEALKVIENLPPHSHVINQTYWGDIIEPITWFKSFIGSVYIVLPNDIITQGFKTILFRYEEEPEINIVDANCKNKTISFSTPDKDGVFKYTTFSEKITEFDFDIFCKTDWTAKKEILRKTMMDAYSQKSQSDVPKKELGEKQ